ncbi:hypothetical protein ABZW10_36405 [Kitasatospora sp. NPDC004723]|uniref:hypothetical protein n=1 Tax=Kitasatospora sp. NPDC004723 TaxID=3154288 RepID=UPI0033A004EC
MGMPTVQYTVAVTKERLRLLDLVATMAAGEEHAWLAEQRREHLGLRGGKLAQARRATRELLAERREAGLLAGSRDWLLVPGVRAELAARGWNRDWPPIPPGALAAGRRWGTDPGRYKNAHDDGETRFLGRLGVRLPAPLGEQLQRGCYWHNAEIEKQLQDWADKWGDGPEVILRQSARENGGGVTVLAGMAAALASLHSPSLDDLAERGKLRAQVVTTGDIVRAAVDHALAAAPERARRERTRLRADAAQARRDVALAQRRLEQAQEELKLAEREGRSKDAANAQDDILHWTTIAARVRFHADQLTDAADRVHDLLTQLTAASR